MTEKVKAGDMITCREAYRSGQPRTMTPGQDYKVISFTENNGPTWPDGCSGRPLVTIVNDLGNEATLLMDRFELSFKYLEKRVSINSLADNPEGELYELAKTTAVLPQYFAKLDNDGWLDLRDHNYFVLEEAVGPKM